MYSFHSDIQLLYSHLCSYCASTPYYFLSVKPMADWFKNLHDLYQKIVSSKNDNTPFDDDLQLATSQSLAKAIDSATKQDILNIDYNTPNYNFYSSIRSNIFAFAGSKNYRTLSEINNKLTENGKIVPFTTFKKRIKEVQNIDQKYNKQYLQAEYQYAKQASLMASKFNEYLDQQDLFPSLEYATAGDDRVRKTHDRLDGIIRPINDKFWDKYYPPNGWRCRCTVYQSDEPNKGYDPKLNLGNNFENNVAKNGNIFSEKHPYFHKNEKHKKQIQEKVNLWAQDQYIQTNKDIYNSYSNDKNYTLSQFNDKTGGFLIKHTKSDKLKPHEQATINKLITHGDRVVLNPLYKAPYSKNPDITLNNAIFDMKSIDGSYTSIRNNITENIIQTKNFLLDMKNFNKNETIKALDEVFRKEPTLNNIILLYQNKKTLIQSQDISRLEEFFLSV